MRVNLAMRGINHQPFVIGLVNQDFQQFFPHTRVAPVRKFQKTAFTNNLLSLAIPPQLPLRPGK
jgi:hypothetical protein